jgi:hypothetical protein
MDVLNEIIAAEKSRKPITGPMVYRWIKDNRAEVLGRLASLLIENPAWFDVDGLDWALEGVVPFLVHAAREPDDDTSFEALENLYRVFRVLWSGREQSPSDIREVRERHLEKIRDEFEKLVADWPSPSADRVVTGVLEHLFASTAIRSYFDRWADDPKLRDVHRVACELSSIGEL